jgi:isoleucyl-tRNA synthetase
MKKFDKTPNFVELEEDVLHFWKAGAILKEDAGFVKKLLEENNNEVILPDLSTESGELIVPGYVHRLKKELFNFYLVADESDEVATTPELVVGLETGIDEVLLEEGLLREMIRELQILRRDLGLEIDDRVSLSIYSTSKEVMNILLDKEMRQIISRELLVTIFQVSLDSNPTTLQVSEHEIQVNLAKV